MKQIPNIFTLLNLVFGCLAIIAILQNGLVIRYDSDVNQYVDIPESITMASLFIGLAAVIDFLDGFVARLFKATSELGKQLDSLADVVSFGVAPALIMYQFLRLSFSREEDGMNVSIIVLLPALLIAAAAAYRLGKFNIDSSQQYGFKGVPTPAVGLLIASFPLIYWNQFNHQINLLLKILHLDKNIWLTFWNQFNDDVAILLLNKWVLYALIIILSWLMISNIPLLALKFKDKTFKRNLPVIILLVIILISIPLFHWVAAIISFAAYIILSLLFKPKR